MQQQKKAAFQIFSSVNFLHDLSLSAEIWQAIRNTDHKHLLHLGHRFFAIIDDKIPGPYTITCCYCLRAQILSLWSTHLTIVITTGL